MPPERKTEPTAAHEAADFGALFALFARRATLDAGAAGRMNLSIGKHASPGGPAQAAQESLTRPAPEAPGLRTPEERDDRGSDRSPRQTREAGRVETGDVTQGRGRGPAELPATGAAARTAEAGASPDQPGSGSRTQEHASGKAAPGTPPVVPGSTNPAAGAPTARVGGGREAGAGAVAAVSSAKGSPGSVGPGAGSGAATGQPSLSAQRGAANPSPSPSPRGPGAQPGAAFRAQLVHGLGAALRRGQGDVILKLRPEMLGDLRVRLSVKGSEVHASIRASTPQAHRLLEESVDGLRTALEARGLHAGRIEIEPAPAAGRGEAWSGGAHGREAAAGSEGESGERAPRESASERERGGGAAAGGGDSQDRESGDMWALGGTNPPGVVYGVADGAARIVMVDALA